MVARKGKEIQVLGVVLEMGRKKVLDAWMCRRPALRQGRTKTGRRKVACHDRRKAKSATERKIGLGGCRDAWKSKSCVYGEENVRPRELEDLGVCIDLGLLGLAVRRAGCVRLGNLKGGGEGRSLGHLVAVGGGVRVEETTPPPASRVLEKASFGLLLAPGF